jgi:hypothetical protein
MNTLECDYIRWGGKEVVAVSLSDLRYGTIAPENKEFYNKLKGEIEKDSMRDPIIVVPITKEQVNKMSHLIIYSIKTNPIDWRNSMANIVMTGNNRMLIAHELGYDSIDCVITKPNNFMEVSRIRKAFQMETDCEANVRR